MSNLSQIVQNVSHMKSHVNNFKRIRHDIITIYSNYHTGRTLNVFYKCSQAQYDNAVGKPRRQNTLYSKMYF